ncbi:Homeodomain-like protein [Radiomyces spectabilis]|uniref:Homeodomain-like protein n=1 Tax=Radiomyces spectabilis TaxID=64574 RepID=UPI00221EF902|nr:Homeodomain-like protein [Radiomyces spectabilis]KAI8384230.1 Homeodomain-like protein [Radiomyces spectabilis]
MDIEKPVLSPSLTPSPASATSSYASYFEGQQEDGWDHLLSKEPRGNEDEDSMQAAPVKAKRRRANPKQLEVLNRVFERTFFPSTQMRAQLGRELGMSPRTVQIWFQNRRQAMRTRERQRLLRIRDESASD